MRAESNMESNILRSPRHCLLGQCHCPRRTCAHCGVGPSRGPSRKNTSSPPNPCPKNVPKPRQNRQNRARETRHPRPLLTFGHLDGRRFDAPQLAALQHEHACHVWGSRPLRDRRPSLLKCVVRRVINTREAFQAHARRCRHAWAAACHAATAAAPQAVAEAKSLHSSSS